MSAPPIQTTSPEISVVVPVYGNRDTLPELLSRLDKTLADYDCEYVFVVDGSPDDSLDVLKSEGLDRPHLRVIEFVRNFGQHAALCAGFAESRGRVIVILDADLQQSPEDLPPFIDAWREGKEFVSGVRSSRRDSFTRRFGSYFMNRLVRSITGVPLRDWGCPMAAIDRRIIDQVAFAGEQRRFLKPLVARLSRNWCEIEIKGLQREGESSYSMFTLIGLSLDFLVSFSNRPFQRLTGVGAALLALGVLLSGVYVILRIAGVVVDYPQVQVGIFISVLIGMQAVILGMLGEFTHRVYRLVQGQPFFELRGEHVTGDFMGKDRP
jgi:undecaprenyl-phosphate 4-deoxy-4-formamido-L-arabinose transferase